MVLEESGEGSDFSVGTMCQELTGSRQREIVTRKTRQTLGKRVPVGGLCVKSRKYCKAGKNLPQELTQRRTRASSPTGPGGLFSSPPVPLLKKGPQWQLWRASCSVFVSRSKQNYSVAPDFWRWVLYSTVFHCFPLAKTAFQFRY